MAITIKTVSSLAKIFPDSEKLELLEEKGSMLKNERYSFQVAIKSDYLLTGVKVKIIGKNAKYCRLRKVDLAPAHQTKIGESDYIIDKSATLYPEILTDDKCDCLSIRLNLWSSLWVTCENLPVGENEIKIALYYKGKREHTVSYFLNVIDENLSDDEVLYTNWMHYDCIANYYNVKPFSKKFYSILGKFEDNAHAHGVKLLYTPLFTPPLDTEVGGERRTVQLVYVEKTSSGYNIDLNRLKEFVDFSQSHGFEYFEFSHLFTQWGAKHAPKIVDISGKKLFGWETDSLGKEYKSFLKQFLMQLNKFIEDNKLVGKCFYHLSDEPHIEHLATFKDISEFVKNYLKNATHLEALSDYDFYKYGLIDIPAVATDYIEPFKGNIDNLWVYYCCCEYQNGLSNRLFNMPSERNRVIGIQLYLNNIKGFLHWGYNFYNSYLSKWEIDPYRVTDGDGLFQAGDPFVVYPGKNCVYDSLRHEVFYDGLQDYRALKRLEEKRGRNFVVELLNSYGYKDDFTTYPRNPEALIKIRNQVNLLLK